MFIYSVVGGLTDRVTRTVRKNLSKDYFLLLKKIKEQGKRKKEKGKGSYWKKI